MILDSEDQRKYLLQLIAAATIPGQALDVIYELKRAIEGAPVKQAESLQ